MKCLIFAHQNEMTITTQQAHNIHPVLGPFCISGLKSSSVHSSSRESIIRLTCTVHHTCFHNIQNKHQICDVTHRTSFSEIFSDFFLLYEVNHYFIVLVIRVHVYRERNYYICLTTKNPSDVH